MQPFTRLSGRAIPLPEENIDTDIIFPARFLLVMEKQGLGRYLFYDRRFTAAGVAREQSVFDDSQYRDAPILIAGANFGCGSSREQAVWALAGFGIRCVIAPSFGEIFHSNCFKSGVLPIVLSQSLILDLVKRSLGGAIFDIDLNSQTIATSDGLVLSFTVEADRRAALLDGMDEIDMILRDELQAIESFEAGHDLAQPWLRIAVGARGQAGRG
jgi:3-isopropylmalate/(R)-2-methylmalate dehydratase small subunit